MHNSGIGQLHSAELRDRRVEPRLLAEANDGDVRKPRTPLGLVDAELVEPAVNILRDPRRLSAFVPADEHADGARLAVSRRNEHRRLGADSRLAQRTGDRLELASRARPEKRE